MSLESTDSRIKFGYVLVRLGIAQHSAVFPQGAPPVSFVAPGDALRPRPTWLEWLGIGTKPIVVSDDVQRTHGNCETAVPRPRVVPRTEPEVASIVDTVNRGGESAAHQVEPAKTVIKAAVFDPALLHDYVREKRESLLGASDMVHSSLLAIEKARRKYLVLDERDACVRELEEVGRCYHFIQRQRELAERDGNAVPALELSTLRCATYVAKLEQCAADQIDHHVTTLP
jgi:hypothetical protein